MEIGIYYPVYNRLVTGEKTNFNDLIYRVQAHNYGSFSTNSFKIRNKTVIRMQAPNISYWSIRLWDKVWNDWFAAVLRLSESEILVFRFRRSQIMDSCIQIDTPTDLPELQSLAVFVIEENYVSPFRLDFMVPWFTPIVGIHRPFYFILTDLVFISIEPGLLDVNGNFVLRTLNGHVWPAGDRYNRHILAEETIDVSKAILLSELNSPKQLFAVPWRSKFKSKHQVNTYCRRIFNWFEERACNPVFAKPCPGQVLFSESLEDRIIVEAAKGFIDTNGYYHYPGNVDALGSEMDWNAGLQTSERSLELKNFFGQQSWSFN